MAVISRERDELAPGALGRAVDLARLNGELLAFAAVVVLSVIAHLYGLGRMAMHHDESIHAWMSWKLLTGAGGFNCFGGRTAPTYCYEPTYHGPALYMFTLASYFLFGDGEWQARLPQALAGIGMVASAWMLRPYLGTRGTIIAAALLAFSPSLLYYTRFARHDGLILLWTLWIVIGFFRFVDTGRGGYLLLAAAGASLAVATHELYYILFFLFFWFLATRVAFELLPRRTVTIALGALAAAMLVLELWNPRLTPTLRAGGMALLFLTVSLAGLLMSRIWDPTPTIAPRMAWLWAARRPVLWGAVAVFAAIYVLMYSTFFADPQSLLAGLYAGIAYWLGSQQQAARGDQPWYYHLMLLTLYEPLGFYGGLVTVVYLFTRGLRLPSRRAATPGVLATDAADAADAADAEANGQETVELPAEEPPAPRAVVPIFPLFLAFWFLGTLVAFSWAGEKMPWLVTHIALPANLLVAWALGRASEAVPWRDLWSRRLGLVPIFFAVMAIALGVAYWRISTPGQGQQGQAALLQGLVPLAVGGGLLYGLLTIGQRAGWRATAALCGMTVAALLAALMTRATWLVVYDHPDTPVDPLVYVQSSPDVPLIVREVRELAISQTRNARSDSDPVGGLSMPVIMDAGDPAKDGEGSLAWPYQWYFRDFKRLESRTSDFFRTTNPDTYIVDPVQPGADRALAPVVLVSTGSLDPGGRAALEANYVRRYDSKLNWWFPEGYKCDPASPGYKRFYYSSWMVADALRDCPQIDPTQVHPIYAPLLWPLDGSHWDSTWKYLLYRDLPEGLRLDGREMEVWVRKDLAPSAGGASAGGGAPQALRLIAKAAFGQPGQGEGQLSGPSSAAVDAQGNVYVADTQNHRIAVFKADGTPLRTFGSLGSGDGQFNEPRGIALDAQGNIYVADTWNARVVKLDPAGKFLKSWGSGTEDFGNGRRASPTDGTVQGNGASPLGFFGPRGIAVDSKGNVYIADTGNKRIVVTDGEGNFLYQWGSFGGGPGQFSEPIGVAVDGGTVFVADTWNGRVQAFAIDESGKAAFVPAATWRVQGWQPQTYDDPFIAARDGKVAFSIPSRNIVMLTDASGAELLRWGGAGSDDASLKLPSGLAFAQDGTVFVVDRGNSRVTSYTLPAVAPPTSGGR